MIRSDSISSSHSRNNESASQAGSGTGSVLTGRSPANRLAASMLPNPPDIGGASILTSGPATEAVAALGRELEIDVSHWGGASHDTHGGLASGFGRCFGDFLQAVDSFGAMEIESVWQSVDSGNLEHHPSPVVTVEFQSGFPYETGPAPDEYSVPSALTSLMDDSGLDDLSIPSDGDERSLQPKPEVQRSLSNIVPSGAHDQDAARLDQAGQESRADDSINMPPPRDRSPI